MIWYVVGLSWACVAVLLGTLIYERRPIDEWDRLARDERKRCRR